MRPQYTEDRYSCDILFAAFQTYRGDLNANACLQWAPAVLGERVPVSVSPVGSSSQMYLPPAWLAEGGCQLRRGGPVGGRLGGKRVVRLVLRAAAFKIRVVEKRATDTRVHIILTPVSYSPIGIGCEVSYRGAGRSLLASAPLGRPGAFA